MTESLIKTSNELNAIFQNAAVVLILIDKERKIVHINQSGLDLIRKDKENILGLLGGEVFNCVKAWSHGKVVCGNSKKCINCDINTRVNDTFFKGQFHYKEEGVLDIFAHDKKVRLNLLISSSKVNLNNEDFVLLTIDDITKQKILETELKKVIATKDKFFSIIAHDLKNPFTSLIGLSEVLNRNSESFKPEKIKAYAENIQQTAKETYDLLVNLLDWSQSQRNSIAFKPEKLELQDLIRLNIKNYLEFAKSKGISLLYNEQVNIQIFADKNMIMSILRNLTNNAIKYTSTGDSVFINAIQSEDEVKISVIDTGIGISSNNLMKLFKIESQLSIPGTNNEKGTGLGLILCQEFVEKHGGKIWAVSKPGNGSEFIFSIPLKKNK